MQRQQLRQLPQNVAPTGKRCIQIDIPDDEEWEQQAFSELYRLALWMLWYRDEGRNGTKVAQQWRKALKTWRHCDGSETKVYEDYQEMPAFREDCKCGLFYKCCDGTEHQVAFLSDIPAASQPGAGAPQPAPGGGSQSYCYQFQANNKLLLPFVVNSGDVITLQEGHGAGNDGGTTNWFCHDGASFFAGLCNPIGGGHNPSDPMPGENHMSLIMDIAGTFYSLEHGPITVPGGVSNAQVFVQINDSDISNNSGSYVVCIQSTNNQLATWEHVFDFKLTSGGWELAATGDLTGVWIPGTGWQGQDNGGGGSSKSEIDVKVSFPSTAITHFEAHSDKPNCSGGNCLDWGGYTEESNQFWAVTGAPTVGTDVIHSWDGTQVCTLLYLNYNTGTAIGPVVLTKVIVRGTGVNPFA